MAQREWYDENPGYLNHLLYGELLPATSIDWYRDYSRHVMKYGINFRIGNTTYIVVFEIPYEAWQWQPDRLVERRIAFERAQILLEIESL